MNPIVMKKILLLFCVCFACIFSCKDDPTPIEITEEKLIGFEWKGVGSPQNWTFQDDDQIKVDIPSQSETYYYDYTLINDTDIEGIAHVLGVSYDYKIDIVKLNSDSLGFNLSETGNPSVYRRFYK